MARQIFPGLAKQGRLSTFGFTQDNWPSQSSKTPPETPCPAPTNSDSFRLWGNDFRAGNILLNESDEIAALIDLEFAYIAPTQFILDPPWWLLLETAEMWPLRLHDWKTTYESRLETWLSAMEQTKATQNPNALPVPLSRYMRESWQTGMFFLSYAARKSWAFDAMYWNFLDERFSGERGTDVVEVDLWKTRIGLLSEEERMAMETFLERKMAEAKARFSDLLFD